MSDVGALVAKDGVGENVKGGENEGDGCGVGIAGVTGVVHVEVRQEGRVVYEGTTDELVDGHQPKFKQGHRRRLTMALM